MNAVRFFLMDGWGCTFTNHVFKYASFVPFQSTVQYYLVSSFILPKVLLLMCIRINNHRPVHSLSLGEHADRFVDPDLNKV